MHYSRMMSFYVSCNGILGKVVNQCKSSGAGETNVQGRNFNYNDYVHQKETSDKLYTAIEYF